MKKIIEIKNNGGFHTRIAALIVNKSNEIKEKYKRAIFIRIPDKCESMEISMLALISLKISKGDFIEISTKDDDLLAEIVIDEFIEFISSFNKEEPVSNVDKLLDQSSLATNKTFDSLPLGIVSVDFNNNITSINSHGCKLLNKNKVDILGKKIGEIIPTSKITKVIKSGQEILGDIIHIDKKIFLINTTPLISDDKVIGAICIFQDISTIVCLKEVNEKLNKILENTHDCICFVDEDRKINYINPAYEDILGKESRKLIGMDLMDISPNGLRMEVFNSKKKKENVLYKKNNISLICNVTPIFIEDTFKGVISISKPTSIVKDILKLVSETEEKANYYKNELRRFHSSSSSFKNIIGNSKGIKDVLVIAEKASFSSSSVLITGESGTGKELLARAIHNNSDRKDKPFIRVNCASIPEALLETELFGLEKNINDNNNAILGKFSIADGGTVFLDEIGDMSKNMQAKLLRVLQEKEFESVGSLTTHKVNVRIIAATNRDLETMISTGEFRKDLYYRLNVISLLLPPLRDRQDDIHLLVNHFIEKICKQIDIQVKSIDPNCFQYLYNYNWPGNIRELENVVERSIILSDSEFILPKDLPIYISNIDSSTTSLINLPNGNIATMEEYEKEIIAAAMKKYKSFNKAGKALGLTHRTISLKCKKYGIEHES